jgi:hypothetical protein
MLQQCLIAPKALGAHGGATNADIIALDGHGFLLSFKRASLRPLL